MSTNYPQISSQSMWIQFQSRMIWNSKLINVYLNSSAQKLIAKTTHKSDLQIKALKQKLGFAMVCILTELNYITH